MEELELKHTNSIEKSHDKQKNVCKNGSFDVLPLSKVEQPHR
jgi:hypothetical protein